MKKIINNLKRKITVLSVAMIAIQPVLVGGMMMPAKTFAAAHDVVINELAWGGSTSSVNDEWIELYNTTGSSIDLAGWTIDGAVSGGALTIVSGTIPANGYFLISHYDQATSKINVAPDLVDSSLSLVNANNQYILKDDLSAVVDTADDGIGAPLAGDNTNKYSMERNQVIADGTLASSWHTATTSVGFDAGATDKGTPKSLNGTAGDIIAPVIEAHLDLTANSTSSSGAVVTYIDPIATDAVDGLVTVICSLPSGSTFPIGVNPVTCSASDIAGNIATSSFTVTVLDKTAPILTLSTEPAFAGPGATSIKIVVTSDEILQQQGFPVDPLNQEAQVLPTCAVCGVTITIDGVAYPAYDPDLNNTYEYIYDFGGFVGAKTVTFTASGTDLAGNPSDVVSGSFEINNVILSPQVTTPTTTVVNAVATIPVDEQFGGSSEQGEVKADTTIQADNGNNTENKDEQKEDTKEKKNIPLWGIIFLLILAGVGGYLFYSQNPEKPTGKK
jgi:hypothetical protein